MSSVTRNRLVLALLVAATAAAFVVPFALRGDGAGVPGPQADPSATAAESSEPSTEPAPEPDDMVVVDRQQVDVDGDGQPDEVRLLKDPSPGEREPADGSVEVTLATGETVEAAVRFGYFDTLLPAVDINGDGREQVLLDHTQGGDSSQLLVYAWLDEGLVRLIPDTDAPLGGEMHEGVSAVEYFLDDSGLHSWLRTDPFDPERWVYEVEIWSWSVEGHRLEASAAGHGCVDLRALDPPRPCG